MQTSLHKENSILLAIDLFKIYPARTCFVLLASFFAGLLEVVSIAIFLPLLNFIDGGDAPKSELQQIVSNVLNTLNLDPGNINAIVLLIIVVVSLKGFFLFLSMRSVGFAMADMANEYRVRLIQGLMKAKWSYFNALPLGHVANSVGTETVRASKAYLGLCKMISEVFLLSIYLLALYFVSPTLTLLAAIMGVIIMAVLYKLVVIVRQSGQWQTKHMADLSSLITDSIASVKIIKAMGREDHYASLLHKETSGLRDAKKKWIVGKESLKTVREPLIVILIVLAAIIAQNYTNIVDDVVGELSMTSMVAFAFMGLRAMQKITSLQGMYQTLIVDESAYWSLRKSIDNAENSKELWGGHEQPVLKKSLEFKAVEFTHEKASEAKKVFDGLSLEFELKKLNAVVGPSGSGKTTLVDLIVGFYTPQSGEILIDGTSLKDADIRLWRQSIGYVPQECPLLHDSIINNIAMGNEHIQEKHVWEALEMAGAEAFVKALDNGVYETVGERGQRFSGGQRQRIAIARALVTKPQLLILDESTSALDQKTEKEIFETAKNLSKEITVIAISHNDAIKDYADYFYMIKDGAVQIRKS